MLFLEFVHLDRFAFQMACCRSSVLLVIVSLFVSVMSFGDPKLKLANPNSGVLPVKERVRGQLNLFRQPMEFALDIAIGFDISKSGSGQLSQLPILTLLVGIAGFFLIMGIIGTPFSYLIDLKKRRFKREPEVCHSGGVCSSPNSFFGNWRGFDVDDGFNSLGMTVSNETVKGLAAFFPVDEEALEEDYACRKYLLCEVHRYFHLLPDWALKTIALVG